ncbi:MAG: phosphoribosyl-AMP cyclohydrolase [Victivallaceae bacterium]|nr:phosphoribosyl-AMP cyclohydrolase [Victivallaceae bacterium]
MTEPDFEKGGGLAVAIAQDYRSGEVLMQAFINADAWQETLSTGRAVYWSRSRRQLWRKGETSGNVQIVHEVLIDCDNDSVIYKVEQIGGAACHTGHRSCFFRRVTPDGETAEISKPVFEPEKVYGKK